MKLELTREQIKDLLRLIYLGNAIALSIRIDNKEAAAYAKLEQYIYSKAADFGLEDHINYDKEQQQFFPAEQLDWNNELQQYKRLYDEQIFWEELTARLARRDFIREYGKKAVGKMSHEERYEKQLPFFERYRKELEQFGLERLVVAD